MKILKFGGSSIGDSERILNVIDIIKNSVKDSGQIAIIFSAFQGVTDRLIKTSERASAGNSDYIEIFEKLEKKHLSIAKDLIPVKKQSGILANIKLHFNELEDVLHGVFLVREISPRTQDFILSFGERLSCYIISNALNEQKIECEFLDSRKLVATDDSFGSAKVNYAQTNKNIKKYFKSHKLLQVITGFIGSTPNNETTTLGRGGSDYTASLFAAALEASEIQIWTDVDGVLTADPKKVKRAFSLEQITYEEAMELSHFGAKVIHPPTMQPAMDKKIPIKILNTFNPSFTGTLINDKLNSKNFSIKGISSIDEVALLRVQGGGMVGVAGTAERIFKALAAKKINITLITQASSEHSLCMAVMPQHAEIAKKAIENELHYEIKDNLINPPFVEYDLSIIAVVGENMRNTPGVSGKVFQALGKNGINISAIAQGSSELNISTVIAHANTAKALNVLHDAFFLSIGKTINLFIVGTGLIGGTLLRQILNQKFFLADEYAINVNIIGLANSRNMYVDKDGIDPSGWEAVLSSEGKRTNLNKFINVIKELNLPNSIFVDCTASDEVVERYKEILDSSISIVTPNKRANSSGYEYYSELKQAALKHNVKFLYETNVGAGLPVINTIKDLVSSGDHIYKIEGVLSGTLSYIFNSFIDGTSFSEIVIEAREKGYTEPDPREDLEGTDVARKLLILAREVGLKMELDDIKVENLVPEPLRKIKSVEQFFVKLKSHDKEFERRRREAQERNNILRYIARLENNNAEISLQEVGRNHPFFSLTGSDNILAFTTKHCDGKPIVIKGPGAGADVTAAGVFADIIRIANYLS